jgi:hypothetical protein
MKGKAITAALCALCALALTAAAQESAPAGPFPPDRSAPRRARAQDIRPPVVAARLWVMSVCGANGYLVKDSAGGYFMFTTHTPDMPHRFTVDYPYTITGAEDPGPPADPGSEFESRPLDDGERKLLAGLLRQWRDAAIPRATLRRFERYDKLKGEAAIKKALESMSEEEQDLLGMWYVIRELEGRRE